MPQKKEEGCPGWGAAIAKSVYKAAGIVQSTADLVALSGVAVEALDLTPSAPVAAPSGLAIATFGLAGHAVANVGQIGAGLYYAAHGNNYPLANAIASGTFGWVHVPNEFVGQAMGKVLDATEEGLEKGARKRVSPMTTSNG